MIKRKFELLALLFCILLFASACKKKVAALPPPPPLPAAKESAPPPLKPVIAKFAAVPSAITRGESSTLSWSVSNATSVTIEPSVGTVQPGGSRQVFPNSTTSFTLVAKGPGGTAEDIATVRVNTPAPTTAAAPTKSFGDLLSAQTGDAYFDYDKSNLRLDARTALQQDATALKDIFKGFQSAKVVVEGHCDERGSAEYNLALGDRRAKEARDYLVEFGVPAAQLTTISYGKERPQCTERDESCWQKNRRAHLAPSAN
jgi:peptidoglycan-associated lipoprotein